MCIWKCFMFDKKQLKILDSIHRESNSQGVEKFSMWALIQASLESGILSPVCKMLIVPWTARLWSLKPASSWGTGSRIYWTGVGKCDQSPLSQSFVSQYKCPQSKNHLAFNGRHNRTNLLLGHKQILKTCVFHDSCATWIMSITDSLATWARELEKSQDSNFTWVLTLFHVCALAFFLSHQRCLKRSRSRPSDWRQQQM